MPLGVRVTVIEPGAVATELAGHNRPEVLEQMAKRFEGVTPLSAEDIANAILYAIGQPPQRERQRGADPPERAGGVAGRAERAAAAATHPPARTFPATLRHA